jgi:hypothetical protein
MRHNPEISSKIIMCTIPPKIALYSMLYFAPSTCNNKFKFNQMPTANFGVVEEVMFDQKQTIFGVLVYKLNV